MTFNANTSGSAYVNTRRTHLDILVHALTRTRWCWLMTGCQERCERCTLTGLMTTDWRQLLMESLRRWTCVRRASASLAHEKQSGVSGKHANWISSLVKHACRVHSKDDRWNEGRDSLCCHFLLEGDSSSERARSGFTPVTSKFYVPSSVLKMVLPTFQLNF